MMMTSSFTVGKGPLPDDVACTFGTCVAAMTYLSYLEMFDLSLLVLKALPERMEPLECLYMNPPNVNWVRGNVFITSV